MSIPPKAALSRLQQVPTKIPSINTDLLAFQEIRKQDGALLLTDENVVLTQDKAAWYIDLPIFEGERLINERHVQFLYDEMARQAFNPTLVILATCEFNKIIWKINGQHTCWAKFNLPKYTPTVREVHYLARTFEQLKQLYAQFDRGWNRSDAHITRVYLSGEGFEGILPDTMSRIIQGFKFWVFPESKNEFRRVGAEDISNLIKTKHRDLVLKVGAYCKSCNSKEFQILKRAPVMAALLATFQKAAIVAPEFWNSVQNGENLGRHDPRMLLHHFLLTASLNVRVSGRKDVNKVVSQEEMYGHCVNCWNKWRAGEELHVLKPMQSRPKAK